VSLVSIGGELDFLPGKAHFVAVNGYKIVVTRFGNDFFAVDDTCTHEEESLSEGVLEDCVIECPRHGAKFDVRTGEVMALPAVMPLKTYKVVYEGDEVKVELP